MRSQTTLEFTLLFIFLSLVFLILFIVLGQRMVSLNLEKESDLVRGVLDTVYDEVALAQTVENGYKRKFNIPKTVMGNTYNLSIDNVGIITMSYNNREYHGKKLEQPMVGGFCPDTSQYPYYNFTVSKEAGIVSLASCFNCRYSYAVCYNAELNNWCDWLSQPALFPGFNVTCCSDHCLCC